MQELSQEQIDQLGFTPTEAELAHVDRMAQEIIQDVGDKRSFEGRRNRTAFKRMRRPHKERAIHIGASKIFAVLDRFEV